MEVEREYFYCVACGEVVYKDGSHDELGNEMYYLGSSDNLSEGEYNDLEKVNCGCNQ